MRRLLAAGLPVVLQVGVLCAPLVHAHLDDHHDDHHDAPAIHAHFGGHGGQHHDGGRVQKAPASVAHDPANVVHHLAYVGEDESEQTTRLQIFVAVAAAPFTAPALPPARFSLAPTPGSVMRRPPDVVRSHGPPLSRATAPRAPPTVSVPI